MTKKPERRKSQLSGLSAIPAPAEPAAVAPEPAPTPAPAAPRQPAVNETAKKKLSYYVTDTDNGRIRAAFLAGQSRYGWRSFTDFQLHTMLKRVEEIEAELNNGEPFEPVPPGGGPLGRPIH